MYEYAAKIVNVVDGDTFDIIVDLGFRISHKVRVRLLGIDTPEKRGNKEKELGIICTRYAEKEFLGKEIIIKSEKEETDLNTDSFGRWLVSVTLKETGETILSRYNSLGINKKADNYSEYNVEKLKLL